jgi:adenylyltransferase/sulfurtransferase
MDKVNEIMVMSNELSSDEITRYKRHILLKEVGGAGQQRLKTSSVLLIGAGGLGSPLALYLAAAGVGTIGIMDDDTVSLDNLQRQVLHDTPGIGTLKVESAKLHLGRLNPHVKVKAYAKRLDAENALEIIGKYDVVVDGSDNFATRYLVNDACYFARRPLVFAAVGPFDGQLATFRAYEHAGDGTPYPSYRCLFPSPPPDGTVAPCSQIGILGAVAGVVGTMAAMEVLKELLGIGSSMLGKLLIYDALHTSFQAINITYDPENPLHGRQRRYVDLSHHSV